MAWQPSQPQGQWSEWYSRNHATPRGTQLEFRQDSKPEQSVRIVLAIGTIPSSAPPETRRWRRVARLPSANVGAVPTVLTFFAIAAIVQKSGDGR